MADTDNQVTGQSVQIRIVVAGVLKQIQDQVTGFTAKERKTEVTRKALGKSGEDIAHEFDGYEGTITISESTAEVDEMMDTINAALQARVPLLINIPVTTFYRDGTSKSYVYPDVKLMADKSVRRGEANGITLNWKTGRDRIAA